MCDCFSLECVFSIFFVSHGLGIRLKFPSVFMGLRANSLTLYLGSILRGPRALLLRYHSLLLMLSCLLSCLFLFFFGLDVCYLFPYFCIQNLWYIYMYHISLLPFSLLSYLPCFAHFITKIGRIGIERDLEGELLNGF